MFAIIKKRPLFFAFTLNKTFYKPRTMERERKKKLFRSWCPPSLNGGNFTDVNNIRDINTTGIKIITI